MAAAAAVAAVGGGAEEEERQRGDYVMALPVALPLAVTVSQMDAGVPRKARTSRPRAVPTGWWAFRLPVPQLKQAKNPPRPKRPRVWQRAPSPGKKARRCLQCGSEVTPQWRSGAMGRSTLCNACGVRLKAAGALRDTEYRPTPATATKAAEPPPPLENPALDSSPDSAICACLPGEVYLVKKQPKRERRIPKKEATPVPAPAPAPPSSPAIFLVRKKKPAKKPYKARNSGQKCLHCGTTSTPQWREGPMGRHTLCNACGVRYRQGRLLPEYRPAASPTFQESKHASRHREVLQLHRQQQNKNQPKPVVDEEMLIPNQRVVDSADAPVLSNGEVTTDNNVFLLRRQRPDKVEYPPTPLHRPLPQPVVDDDPRVAGSNNNNSTAVGAVSGSGGVDELLDGPSAPPIVDGDAFFVD